jgi:hypothetical protein
MKTQEFRTINKSKWPRGPWDFEPDKVQYTDHDTGLPCLIVRHPSCGQLCGYANIRLTYASFCQEARSEDFLKWNQSMKDRTEEALQYPNGDAARDWETLGHLVDDFEGWTEYQKCSGICHETEEGDNDKVWWFGFDCAHSMDYSPGIAATFAAIGHTDYEEHHRLDIYRDIAYVKAEIASLAKQLKERDSGPVKKFLLNLKWAAAKAFSVW